ncbi:MAG: hypothetical protein Q4B99_04685 [Clostridia bacterium]|nr:hypothetical protein [Clostridia bacterium]
MAIAFIIFIALYAAFLCFYAPAMDAARAGFELWLTAVMPALFPFMVCASILHYSGVISRLMRLQLHDNVAVRLLSSLALFAVCALSGSPAGARVYGYYFGAKRADVRSAFTCSLCNLCGPMFIVGAVCTSMLNMPALAPPILIGHYATALAGYLAICAPRTKGMSVLLQTTAERHSLSHVITASIASSMEAMLKVCATIVFFMVCITALDCMGAITLLSDVLNGVGIDEGASYAIAAGVLELTNGCALLSESTVSAPLMAGICAAIVSFGGVCVYFQARAFINLPAGVYFCSKLLHAAAAFAVTYALTPAFCYDANEAFGGMTPEAVALGSEQAAIICTAILISVSTVILAGIIIGRRLKRLPTA